MRRAAKNMATRTKARTMSAMDEPSESRRTSILEILDDLRRLTKRGDITDLVVAYRDRGEWEAEWATDLVRQGWERDGLGLVYVVQRIYDQAAEDHRGMVPVCP
jgi:hypothetical protein